jgi:hypothetical protein
MTDITPTTEQLNTARRGIYLQLRATTNLVEQYGSVAMAIEVLGMNDFIENQVEVIASCRAWVSHTENRLRHEESVKRVTFDIASDGW